MLRNNCFRSGVLGGVSLVAVALTPGVLLAQGAEDGESLDCVIEASEIAEVSTAVRGIMWNVNVDRGDWVEKGQVLAELEASVEEATVTLARAQAESTKEVEARKARVDLARKQLRRVRELSTSQVVASQVVDEAETNMVVEELALDQAYEDRRFAALELERAQAVLDLRTIRSPITGVVVQIYTSASELVELRPIMQIAQIDPLYVEAIAPVERFGTIEEGAVLEVFPEEPIGGSFTATVSLVERVIDASSGTFGIRLVLPNPDRSLPAGLQCRLGFPN